MIFHEYSTALSNPQLWSVCAFLHYIDCIMEIKFSNVLGIVYISALPQTIGTHFLGFRALR